MVLEKGDQELLDRAMKFEKLPKIQEKAQETLDTFEKVMGKQPKYKVTGKCLAGTVELKDLGSAQYRDILWAMEKTKCGKYAVVSRVI